MVGQEIYGVGHDTSTIIIIVLILLLIGALPTWPHSRGWNYGPTGLIGVLLIVAVILMLMKVI